MTAHGDTVQVGRFTVGRLGLGTMSLTGAGVWGPPADPEGARAVLRRARELGIDFFDTADAYGPGTSEELLADTLHPYDGIVVATKGGLTRQGPGRWSRNGRPEHLKAACEASLRRLRVDAIDLYQLHAVDPDCPLAESLGALVELVAEGKVKEIGICNVAADQLRHAVRIAPLVSVQNRFSLADRSSLHVIAAGADAGLAFIAWAPLAKGGLARSRRELAEVGAQVGASPSQVALAWVLGVAASTIAIPGTSSRVHLEENCAAADVHLSADQLRAVEAVQDSGPGWRARVRGVLEATGRAVRS